VDFIILYKDVTKMCHSNNKMPGIYPIERRLKFKKVVQIYNTAHISFRSSCIPPSFI